MQNPILNAINSYNTNGMARASNMAGNAMNTIDKGASIMLKMDQLLSQEEARATNERTQAEIRLTNGIQSAIDNNFKQAQIDLQNEKFKYKKGRDTKSDGTTADAADAKAYDDRVKNFINIYNKVPSTNELTGMPIPEEERLRRASGAMNSALTFAGANQHKIPANSTYSGTVTKPMQNSSNNVSAPTTLNAPAATNTTATNVPAAAANTTTSSNNQFSELDDNTTSIIISNIASGDKNNTGFKIVSGGFDGNGNVSNEAFLNPNFRKVLSSALTSTNKNTALQASKLYGKLPKSAKDAFDAEIATSFSDRLQLDADGNIALDGGEVGNHTESGKALNRSINMSNNMLSTNGISNTLDSLKNKSVLSKAIGNGIDWLFNSDSVDKEAATVSNHFKDLEVKLSKNIDAGGLGIANPVSSAVMVFNSIVNPTFSNAKNFKFGFGLTGNNIKYLNTPWKMTVGSLDDKGKPTGEVVRLSDFIPNTDFESLNKVDTSVLIKDKISDATIKGLGGPLASVAMSAYKDYKNIGNDDKPTLNKGYTKDQERLFITNRNNMLAALQLYVKNNTIRSEGKTFLDTSKRAKLKVFLADANKNVDANGKMSGRFVEMSVQEASVFAMYMLRGQM